MPFMSTTYCSTVPPSMHRLLCGCVRIRRRLLGPYFVFQDASLMDHTASILTEREPRHRGIAGSVSGKNYNTL